MSRRCSSFPTLAACAAAAILAVPAPASAAGALSPPVIKESFTPLSCSGAPKRRSTLQQEGCAERQILKTDTAIDGLNATRQTLERSIQLAAAKQANESFDPA